MFNVDTTRPKLKVKVRKPIPLKPNKNTIKLKGCCEIPNEKTIKPSNTHTSQVVSTSNCDDSYADGVLFEIY
jgi:hypothetical protein